eukprot:GHVL01034169.1.p1 GENE.GHVL01034169.1~~GHVL01034169.1.p1  ORF type:complete len:175 (+),score=5.21 GHVL01034169.1:54-578(+)
MFKDLFVYPPIDFASALLAAPLPISIWVTWLLLCNIFSFVFIYDLIGWFAIGSILFILLINSIILSKYKGLCRIMGLPHLLVWIPLIALILIRLSTDMIPSIGGITKEGRLTPESNIYLFLYSVILLITNTISVLFDIVDTIRWFRGDREVIIGAWTAKRLSNGEKDEIFNLPT